MKEDISVQNLTERIKELESENSSLKSKLRFHESANLHFNSFEIFRNIEGEIIYVSIEFEQVTGYRCKDLCNGKINFLTLVIDEDKMGFSDFFSMSIESRQDHRHNCRIVHKNKSVKYLSISVQPIYDDDNKQIGCKANCIDITEFKEKELAHKASEEKLNLLNRLGTETLSKNKLEDIYKFIIDSLHECYPKTILLYISIDEAKNDTKLEAHTFIDRSILNRIIRLTGFNPIGKHYKLRPELNGYFRSGKFVEFKDGLAEFTGKVLPPFISRAIERLIGIKKIYTIGIVKDDQLMSAIHFLSLDEQEIKDKPFIETFIQGVGTVMQKIIAEQELKESEKKYRMLFENIPYGFQLCEMITNENNEPTDYQFIETNELFACFSRQGASGLKGKTIKEINPEVNPDIIKIFGEVASTATPCSTEYFSKTFNKHIRLHAYSPQKNQIAALYEDISERKKAEEDLKQSEKNHTQFFNTLKDFIWILDEKGNIIYANDYASTRLGYTKDEIHRMHVLEIHPEERRENAMAIVMKMLNGETEQCEIPLISKSKEYIPVETRVVKGIWNGEPVIYGISKDISELKLSEEKFSKAFYNNANLMAISIQETGEYIEVNQAFLDTFEIKKEEVIGKTSVALGLFDPEARKEIIGAQKKTKKISNLELEVRFKDKKFYGLFSADVIHVQEKTCLLSVMQDITKLKETQNELIKSEEKLKAIVSLTPAIISIIQPSGKITYNSPFAHKILGYDYDFTGFNIFGNHLIHPDDQALVEKSFKNLLTMPGETASVQYRCLSKDHGYVWMEATGKNYLDTAAIAGILVVVQDISKRKMADLALSESETRLRMVIESSKEGTWDWNIETGSVIFNEYWAMILGCSLDDLAPNVYTWDKVIHPDDMPLMMETIVSHLKGKTDSFQLEHRVRTQCGDWKWVLTHGKVIEFDHNNRPLRAIGTHVDIDELKRTYENLKKLNKQLNELNATKDKFFSIIAHDLKNPFSVLLSSCELLFMYLEKKDLEKAKSKAEMIYSSSKQGHTLLQNLLEWSQSQIGCIKFEPASIPFKQFIEESLCVVEGQAKSKNIEIEINIDTESEVYADCNIMQVVIRNLVTNAIKFTAPNGRISIYSKSKEEYTEISVKDNGIGINEETIKKLFRIDTKISSKGTNDESGTGLGLILCKEFIEKHGGHIWVESELGKGSTFKFTLPKHGALSKKQVLR